MRVSSVTSNSKTFNGLTISYKNNRHVPFVAGDVLDIVKANKLPAEFNTEGATLKGKITEGIKQSLEKLKIVFEETK